MRAPRWHLVAVVAAVVAAMAGCPEQAPTADAFSGASSGGQDVGGFDTLAAQDADPVSTTDGAGSSSETTGGSSGAGVIDAKNADVSVLDSNAAPFEKPCAGPKELVFSKAFGTSEKDTGYGIVALADGSLVVLSTTEVYDGPDNGLLTRFTSSGAQIWKRSYGGGKDSQLRGLVALKDGGFALAGGITEDDDTYDDMWLLRVDKDGNVGDPGTWTVIEGHKDRRDYAYGVTEGHDGAIVMVGETRNNSTKQVDGRLFAVKKDGKPLWDQITGFSGTDILRDVVTVPSGYVAAGEAYSGGNGMWAVKVDKKGEVVWSKQYGKDSNDVANAVVPRPEGGTLIGGEATIYSCMWLLALDDNGAVAWKHELCDKQSEEAHALAVVNVGGKHLGYAALGRSSTGGSDAFLVRIDPLGNRLWTAKFAKYHGGNDAKGLAIAALPDGGFAMTGEVYKQPGNQGGYDLLVMRTDRWGHAGCKFDSSCADLPPTQCVAKDACQAPLCDAVDGCHFKPLEDDAPCGPGLVCKAGKCL